ncbi:MAG: sigma-54-dependent Fis family transcriptional regulator [Bacteroidales bacterium]|nr:sigma-54-dependent Fis family transcriptional regulator [Bacteroidales bacterium]
MPAETVSRAEVVRAKQRFSIIGNSEALNSAIERAVKVAPIDLSVLVTGESGSGKEFFPKIIHQYGARKHKKYIAVNCGAIPEGTIDSELFGHEKGSFTGALSDRKGYFEEADGGTIFLDEVAELPLTTQARLLRVLETGEFLKVGSSKVQKTDIRVVAATNADLLKAVRAGKFREDLYYRLSTVIIQVPNLHDRGDDVLLLARKFASDFSERYMTAPIRFSEEAGELLLAYRWPGNVRQLKNIVEQLALFDSGETITRRRLIEVIPHPADTNLQVSAESHSYENEREHLWQALLTLKKEVEALRLQLSERGDVTDHHPYSPMRSIIKLDDPAFEPLSADILSEGNEKQQIIDALRRCKGSKREAAKMLEMSERTLYRRLHELDITPDKYS